MTLVSIIQGFAIAILFEIFLDNFDINDPDTIVVIPRFIVSFFCFSLVWHKFINFKQFHSWTLSYEDTMLVMGFAVIEGGMITFSSNMINKDFNFVGIYYMIFSLTFLGAVNGYKHAISELIKSYNVLLLEEHYDRCPANNNCSKKVFNILLDANYHSIKICKKFGIISVIASVPILIFANSELYHGISCEMQLVYESIIAIPAIGLYVFFIIKYDIRYLINKWEHHYLDCNNKKVIEKAEKIGKHPKLVI